MRTDSVVLGLVLILVLPAAVTAQGTGVDGVVRAGARPATEAVVWLEADGVGGEPSSSGQRPLIDQKSLRFEPDVLVVRPGTRVSFLNSDPILHNVFSPGSPGPAFDLGTYPSGTARSHVFTEPGPHVILCHVHPEMAAYVVVVATPHHALTDSEGRFSIEDVPPGRYRLTVWRRGSGSRTEDLLVPPAGLTDVVLDLSGAGGLVRGGQP